MKHKFYLILSLVFSSFIAFSQTDSLGIPINKIYLVAKVTKNEIILRYAPSTPIAWYYANQYGYSIVRETIMRDTTILPPGEDILLTSQPLKPAPKAEWENNGPEKYVAIAYQAIYGEKFEVNQQQSTLMQVQDLNQELVNRFSFSLFACDHSVIAAELSGLIFHDTHFKQNEKYVYKIYINVPPDKAKIDTGTLFVNPKEITDYPKPIGLSVVCKDRIATLQWNELYYQGIYTSWQIERSDDAGKTFKVLNENPYVFLQNGKDESDDVYYLDSLPANDVKYLYRIKGFSAFGDLGPASDTVSGSGQLILPAIPYISKVIEGNKNNCFISWEFPDENNANIKGFKILSSDKDDGVYNEVNKDLIPPDKRLYIDVNPMSVNYYRIEAIDNYNKPYSSLSFLFQMSDSLPPEAPKGLKGKIDSTGNVIITWNKNTEKDVSGYRVFMSNSLNDEFSQITRQSVRDSFFVFQTTLNTLTKEMYVKVMAEDNRFNPSKFSAIIKVTRPDTIKPSSPIFKSFHVSDTGITVEWINSSSKDVVNHILYRSLANKNNWTVVATFDNVHNPEKYCDTSAKSGQTYDYAIIAVDDSENKSLLGNTIQLQMQNKTTIEEIKNFKGTINRDLQNIVLSWKLPVKPIYSIIIYRKAGDDILRIYKTIYESIDKFTDKNLQINTNYEYQIRFIYQDQTSSAFSKKVILNY